MSAAATMIERPNGGPRAAAVFVRRHWLYFRASDRSADSRRTAPMLPDPATRPVVSAEEAFAELGIDRSTGYRAIRDGTFPLPVIHVGRVIRVPTAALRRLLEIDRNEGLADIDRSEDL
jgi:predicted DNA-binding transcriptional regulator AlpA